MTSPYLFYGSSSIPHIHTRGAYCNVLSTLANFPPAPADERYAVHEELRPAFTTSASPTPFVMALFPRRVNVSRMAIPPPLASHLSLNVCGCHLYAFVARSISSGYRVDEPFVRCVTLARSESIIHALCERIFNPCPQQRRSAPPRRLHP
jgi:hypothetical protein